MSAIAARDATTVLRLSEEVAAIHLLAVAQGIELRGVESASTVTRRVHDEIRRRSPFVGEDRSLQADIDAVLEELRTRGLIKVEPTN